MNEPWSKTIKKRSSLYLRDYESDIHETGIEGIQNDLNNVQTKHHATFILGWPKEKVYKSKPKTLDELENKICNVLGIVQ